MCVHVHVTFSFCIPWVFNGLVGTQGPVGTNNRPYGFWHVPERITRQTLRHVEACEKNLKSWTRDFQAQARR